MGKSETRKPWSFGLFGGKTGGKSIVTFFVILIISILVHLGGAIYYEIQDRRARPVLSLKSLVRDIREFIRIEKRMPLSFREIKEVIWNHNVNTSSRQLLGDNIYTANNYEYIYHSGKVAQAPVVFLWAIPLGKYREDYDTVLVIISTEGETIWRGPALTEKQRFFVLEKGFNPSYAEMSLLNLRLETPPSRQKKGLFF